MSNRSLISKLDRVVDERLGKAITGEPDRRAETLLERAIETRDLIEALRLYGLSQSAIARAAGASERSVRNWQNEGVIRSRYEERLRDLQEVMLILRESLTPRGVGQWLRARNRLLKGQRPLDLIAKGEVDFVSKAAHSYVEGAYV